MKMRLLLILGMLSAPVVCRADDWVTQSQVETMQRNGWITPQFESSARALIDAKEKTQKAENDMAALEVKLPLLEKSAKDDDAKAAKLKEELTHYDHPEETDFVALQDAMKNSSALPEDQMAQAQAYVWTYPTGPHTDEAGKILQQIEKKIADATQAVKDAAAAREAAQLNLLQRVKAHNLSLGEWRSFLQDKSEDEVLQYLGTPTKQDNEGWTYSGNWTVDPTTTLKSGLLITFNGGRVQNVAPIPAQ